MSERKIEKRNRPPVSCNPCRTRKLKCNRALPCDTCIRRGKADICQYAPNADRTKAEAKKGAVADQLKRLEDMISTLAEQKTSPSTTATNTTTTSSTSSSSAQDTTGTEQSKPDSEPSSQDAVDSPPKQPGFTEANHWLSIIEDIKDIRAQLSPAHAENSASARETWTQVQHPTENSHASSPTNSSDLGFRQTSALSLDYVLKSLPSKQLCDYWVASYFQAKWTALPLLHPTRFQQEYESFWEDHNKVSPIWIALLFAILALASGTTKLPVIGNGETPRAYSVQELSSKTEECLIIGSYTDGGEYVMETLVLHLQSFYLTGKDASKDVWFTAGTVVRLALRLGYHRDPSTQRNLANLSPYACEMRRRVWITIYQLDALISFQVGLPSMIPVDSCDTRPPMNLELSYLDPDMQELPEPRPMTDHTTATYSIAKQPVIDTFRKIVAHTTALTPRPYEETLELDNLLRTAYNGMPDILQAKPISRFLVDGTALVIRRMTLEFLFLKSVIILHRQHLAHHGNAVTSLSHQACLTAALTMLERMIELHDSMRPGGILYNDRWLLTTLSTSDMIFASVVVCLDLTIRVTTPPCACHSGLSTMPQVSVVTMEMALEAIQRAQKCWDDFGETSNEARIAAGTIETTIQRVQEYQKNQETPYEALQRVSFNQPGAELATPDGANLEMLGDTLHWEFIDQWMPDSDEMMPDLASWVLNGTG